MSTSSSRRSMVMVSASPLSSSSSLHQSRGLSAKATATAAEGGDGGGDADAGGALTVMGRIIDTELKDEAEKSYIAVRRREERGGQRRRNSPPSFFFSLFLFDLLFSPPPQPRPFRKTPNPSSDEQNEQQYAMSVIVGRALPDVRDGLKPVHRRILFAMHGLSLSPSTPHRKCARVVGEVLGKYHPHGDTAVYDALVRLAQPFSMRSPLVDGHGNFGSLDADPPAAMRYTECRLRALSAEVLLRDLAAEGTVRMAPNFDGSVEEPTVLPARVPLLLVNGSSGIAVGIATRIPPHNLREVVAAMTLLVRKPEASTQELMRLLPAPDFPTGGEILDAGGVATAYETGRGPVTVRGKVDIEIDGDGGKKAKKAPSRRGRKGAAAAEAAASAAALSSADSDTEAAAGTAPSQSLSALDDASLDGAAGKTRIVISELPYQTNKAAFVQRVAELVDEGALVGIADVRDESDRAGTRVVVELRRGVSARVVLGSLYKQTPLQVSSLFFFFFFFSRG